MLAYMQVLFTEFFLLKKLPICYVSCLNLERFSQLFAFLTWRLIFFNSDKVKPINRHVGTENQKKSNYSN